jgi:chromosome segregation protein
VLLREIILENFMSYEYARIPLKPGLNIICGPNGSGKSSLLLAISVALGQAYTERSRKLSDLIRWGADSARVTLVFDNTSKRGKRPVPRFDVDYFRVSRYLKKDGAYWFEVNFKTVNKREVTAILNEFGINPDNMLITMHQRMMEEFGITTLVQRLTMVEEAVGLGAYRQNVLEAQDKLTQVLSQEESVKTLFENAEQTLVYWEEEYEKYQRRNEVLQRQTFLRRELVWAELARLEAIVAAGQEKVEQKEASLVDLEQEIARAQALIQRIGGDLNALRFEQRQSFYSLMTLEKEKTEHQVTAKIGSATLNKLGELQELTVQPDAYAVKDTLDALEGYVDELHAKIFLSQTVLKGLDVKTSTLQSQLAAFDEERTHFEQRYVDERVREGLLTFQSEAARRELTYLKSELGQALRGVEAFQPRLEAAGAPMKAVRSPQEISDDLRVASIQLTAMGELSEDVEQMYLTYLNVFNDLKQKVAVVSENRAGVLNEVAERKRLWISIIQSLLDEVSVTYQKFLSRINATGNIRLVNTQDIEAMGLELTVGFKGAEPAILDSYTQSGGERSTATMAFLLALQQYVKSPFRAVDEFDIHMDPKNRETISGLLYQEVRRSRETQYLTITPGQITNVDEAVHVITVQNLEGRSEVSVVE